MLECKICGTKFNAIVERHYIARDNGRLDWQLPLVLLPRRVCTMPLTARCVVVR